jgi:hypothetical protein
MECVCTCMWAAQRWLPCPEVPEGWLQYIAAYGTMQTRVLPSQDGSIARHVVGVSCLSFFYQSTVGRLATGQLVRFLAFAGKGVFLCFDGHESSSRGKKMSPISANYWRSYIIWLRHDWTSEPASGDRIRSRRGTRRCWLQRQDVSVHAAEIKVDGAKDWPSGPVLEGYGPGQ